MEENFEPSLTLFGVLWKECKVIEMNGRSVSYTVNIISTNLHTLSISYTSHDSFTVDIE